MSDRPTRVFLVVVRWEPVAVGADIRLEEEPGATRDAAEEGLIFHPERLASRALRLGATEIGSGALAEAKAAGGRFEAAVRDNGAALKLYPESVALEAQKTRLERHKRAMGPDFKAMGPVR